MREARVFLLDQGLLAVEFEGEGLESGAVVGAERFGGKLSGGEGACGIGEDRLQREPLVNCSEQVRGVALVTQGSDKGVDSVYGGGVR